MAFKSREDAEQVRSLLIEDGFDERELEIAEADQITDLTRQHLSKRSNVTRSFGSQHESEARYLQLAKDGHVFLLACAPADLDADRLMRVILRFNFVLADKFDRLPIHH